MYRFKALLFTSACFQRSHSFAGHQFSSQQRYTSRSLSSRSPTRDEDIDVFATPPSVLHANSTEGTCQKSFEDEFCIKRATTQATDKDKELSLAETLLKSKQNILVQSSFTKAELYRRSRNNAQSKRGSSEESQTSSKSGDGPQAFKSEQHPQNYETLELHDIEDDDWQLGDKQRFNTGYSVPSSPRVIKTYERDQLDSETSRRLKLVVFGPRGVVQDGWINQGFMFSSQFPFGLIQKKVSAFLKR